MSEVAFLMMKFFCKSSIFLSEFVPNHFFNEKQHFESLYSPARSSAANPPSGSILLSACRGDVRDGIVPQTASAIRGLVWVTEISSLRDEVVLFVNFFVRLQRK